MFCSKCGKEIPNDSMFCLSCGNKILENITTEIVKQDQTEVVMETTNATKKFAKRSVDLSHVSMDRMGIKETVYTGRIDSVKDKELNEKLFTLYAKLIAPVREMERQMWILESAKRDLRKKTYLKLPWTKSSAIMIGLYVILLFIVAIWSEMEWYGEVVYGVFIKSIIFFGVDQLTAEILSGLFLTFLMPAVMLGLVQLFLFSLQPLIDARRHARDKKMIVGAKETIDRIETLIAPYVAYVPIRYRYSHALEHFCNAYNNTEVDNLKEAVNSYINKVRHEELLEEIKVATAMVVDHLQYIEYQNENMLAKMDSMENSITASIWASSFAFRW